MPSPGLKLILASGSPQRRNLLTEAGYTFRIVTPRPHAECGVCSKETPGELVARLAFQKAVDVLEQLGDQSSADKPSEIVVACDTVAECLGNILGKPVDRAHARQMLHLLRGREHHVYSGLCVWPLVGKRQVCVARTTLRMDEVPPSELEEYLESGQWEGKAGAFGYQDRVGWLHIVEGSESNVVGLPMELLAEMLAQVAFSAAQQGPN